MKTLFTLLIASLLMVGCLAPKTQQQALWQAVSKAVEEQICGRPLWLNTAGGGVAWLHVRLDSTPKYYQFAPYRKYPHG